MRTYQFEQLLRQSSPPRNRSEAMATCIRLLWDAFAHSPLSWIGFYEKVAGTDEMVLVCREPKPACSPIGLHGMCGRGWIDRRSIIIADVRTLGGNYIACDPRDQSELVVPCMNSDGTCWGVLDADSYDTNAFDDRDEEGMHALLRILGLTSGQVAGPPLRL